MNCSPAVCSPFQKTCAWPIVVFPDGQWHQVNSWGPDFGAEKRICGQVLKNSDRGVEGVSILHAIKCKAKEGKRETKTSYKHRAIKIREAWGWNLLWRGALWEGVGQCLTGTIGLGKVKRMKSACLYVQQILLSSPEHPRWSFAFCLVSHNSLTHDLEFCFMDHISTSLTW